MGRSSSADDGRPLKRSKLIMTSKTNEHPMVPVPEAIRTVLRETARILLTPGSKPDPFVTISVNEVPEKLLGKVLSKDVIMKEPGYPPYNASIMDGYAIRTKDVYWGSDKSSSSWTHHVFDRVHAGDEQAPKLEDSSCSGSLPPAYYITTGAVVPDGFDCVVPIEEIVVSENNDKIRILPSAKIESATWIRPIGCDISAGSVVLSKGDTIDPVALGLIKQAGVDSVSIHRPLTIGVLSTGNELIVDGTDTNRSGKIPDVNRPLLLFLLSSFGSYCQPLDLGNERDDDVLAMAKTIDSALEVCDVIITTGGISMGETDIVEQVLVEHCRGSLHFGRMHMKPGKPTTFVTIPKGDAVGLVFAMPGNPVSAMVCTQLLVRPCLDLLYYGSPHDTIDQVVENALVHREIEAQLTHDIKLDQQRPEYHRVKIQRQNDGTLGVTSTGNQRSSRLLSCQGAEALVVLPVGSTAKPIALKEETYPVLILGTLRDFDKMPVKHSKHLVKQGPQYQVAVVEVVPNGHAILSQLDDTCLRVVGALSGTKSGQVEIVSKKTFSGNLDSLFTEIVDSNGADLVVVSCVPFPGDFPFHLDVASILLRNLSKPAKALSLQARQGAASEDPTAANFEVVTGYVDEGQGAIVISLPTNGVTGGLGNVRGLLKHSVNVARGKPHNDHHMRAPTITLDNPL